MDEEKYTHCWVCNSLILKSRIEKHHILGGKNSEETTDLCVICHDLVDRMPLENIEVFQEFLTNTLKEMERLPEDFKWTKLYLLKMAKIIASTIKLPVKDKQEQINNKEEKE